MLDPVFLYRLFGRTTDSIFTLLKILLKSSLSPQIPQKSKPFCLILGNGPSLDKNMDYITEIKTHCNIFCVNAFPSSDYFSQVRPQHYVIVSREYYFPDNDRPREQKIRDKVLQDLVSRTTWEINFFLPYEAKTSKKFLEIIRANKNIKPMFYNSTPIEGLTSLNHLLMDFSLGMPRPHNVLIPSIFLALTMKYQSIFLLGADHSWLPQIEVTNKNEALVNQKHFYDRDSSRKRSMHLNGKPRKLHEILHKFYLSFKAYHELHQFAIHKGLSIYNCTEGSFIDAFNRLMPQEIRSIFDERTKQ